MAPAARGRTLLPGSCERRAPQPAASPRRPPPPPVGGGCSAEAPGLTARCCRRSPARPLTSSRMQEALPPPLRGGEQRQAGARRGRARSGAHAASRLSRAGGGTRARQRCGPRLAQAGRPRTPHRAPHQTPHPAPGPGAALGPGTRLGVRSGTDPAPAGLTLRPGVRATPCPGSPGPCLQRRAALGGGGQLPVETLLQATGTGPGAKPPCPCSRTGLQPPSSKGTPGRRGMARAPSSGARAPVEAADPALPSQAAAALQSRECCPQRGAGLAGVTLRPETPWRSPPSDPQPGRPGTDPGEGLRRGRPPPGPCCLLQSPRPSQAVPQQGHGAQGHLWAGGCPQDPTLTLQGRLQPPLLSPTQSGRIPEPELAAAPGISSGAG